jgi:hypothetical protein
MYVNIFFFYREQEFRLAFQSDCWKNPRPWLNSACLLNRSSLRNWPRLLKPIQDPNRRDGV